MFFPVHVPTCCLPSHSSLESEASASPRVNYWIRFCFFVSVSVLSFRLYSCWTRNHYYKWSAALLFVQNISFILCQAFSEQFSRVGDFHYNLILKTSSYIVRSLRKQVPLRWGRWGNRGGIDLARAQTAARSLSGSPQRARHLSGLCSLFVLVTKFCFCSERLWSKPSQVSRRQFIPWCFGFLIAFLFAFYCCINHDIA